VLPRPKWAAVRWIHCDGTSGDVLTVGPSVPPCAPRARSATAVQLRSHPSARLPRRGSSFRPSLLNTCVHARTTPAAHPSLPMPVCGAPRCCVDRGGGHLCPFDVSPAAQVLAEAHDLHPLAVEDAVHLQRIKADY
jgi:hypothetical protein